MKRVRLVIHGRVQGVGFRYFALRQAQALGVAGHASNHASGTVEIEAEGDPGPMDRFVEAMKQGPQSSRVDRVDEDWDEGPSRHRSFRIHG